MVYWSLEEVIRIVPEILVGVYIGVLCSKRIKVCL